MNGDLIPLVPGDLAPLQIAAMDDAAIARVRELEAVMFALPQVPIFTGHVLHAGMYARTIFIPAGVAITGVLVKIATLLIVQGDATVFVNDGPMDVSGYNVVPASAGRKQAFHARGDVYLTMMFPTAAQTVEEAEHQFTDEFDLLASHRDERFNHVTITGE